MKIIIFKWIADLVLAGKKTSTIRAWRHEHAAKFKKGDLVQAYDGSPCGGKTDGGMCFAILRLTRDPFTIRLQDLTAERVAKEGHPEMSVWDFKQKYFPRTPDDKPLSCVEFELAPPMAGQVEEL